MISGFTISCPLRFFLELETSFPTSHVDKKVTGLLSFHIPTTTPSFSFEMHSPFFRFSFKGGNPFRPFLSVPCRCGLLPNTFQQVQRKCKNCPQLGFFLCQSNLLLNASRCQPTLIHHQMQGYLTFLDKFPHCKCIKKDPST